MANTQHDGSPEAPLRISSYEIQQELGRGAMGAVYLARHHLTDRVCALKVVLVPNPVFVQGIRREIYALTRLRHPGVVAVVDDGVDAGLPWYAMEYVAGQTLREACDAFPHPGGGGAAGGADFLPRVLSLIRRICWSLAYVHGEGVVHGDLKPSNILVTTEERPVLVDFGMARWIRRGGPADEGGSREALEVRRPGGTLTYIAPEVLQHGGVDARADLYALGCIIFELIAGRPPFVGAGSAVARAQVRDDPPRLATVVAGIPDRLDRLVAALLEKRPRSRIGYADLVADELERIGAPAPPWLGAPPTRVYLYRPGFHGRDAALAALTARLEQVLSGAAGGMLLVHGESGIGKTKLLMELGRRADRQGMLVITEECASGQDRHLQIVRKLLLALCDQCRALGRELTESLFGTRGKVLAQLEPAIATLPGQQEHADPIELGPEESRLRLFSFLADTLRALAAQERLLLLVDDLQWADELSLGLLSYLTRGGHLREPPTVIVGAFRSEELGPELNDLITVTGGRPLELGRLDGDAVSSIIADMLALPAPAHALAEQMMRHSEGNPFFVSEYLYAAANDGLLKRGDRGAWMLGGDTVAAANLASLPLPATLRELLDHRFAALSAASGALLEAMSVLGREAPAPLAESVSTVRGRDFHAAVMELVDRKILVDLGAADVLRFSHDKIREAAYGRLPEHRKKHLHREAASALAADLDLSAPASHADTFARDSGLARHWELAGETAKACTCYARAGKAAAAAFANGDAVRLFEKHLELRAEPGEERVEVRFQLAEVLYRMGRLAAASGHQDAGLAEAEALGADQLVVTGLRTSALLYLALGDVDAAERIFRRGILLAHERGDGRAESLMQTGLGTIMRRRHRPDEALRCHRRALKLARACADPATQCIVLSNQGSLAWSAHQWGSARRCFEKVVAVARSLGDRRIELMSLMNLGVVLGESGDRAGAIRLLSRSLQVAREMGDRNKEGIILSNLGASFEQIEELATARRHYETSLRLAVHTGDHWNVALRAFNLGTVCLRSGAYDDGRRHLAAAIEEARRLNDEWIEAIATTELIGGARRQGDSLAELHAPIDAAIRSLTALGKRGDAVDALCEKGHLLLAAGASAAEILTRIAALAAEDGDAAGIRAQPAVTRLQQAQAAFASGAPLVRGEVERS
ncbi:MAG: tetratricopeptide repeat protein [Candidatus Schekmanbacteria bacterium]|nr:tetratricopeptide repeat protein [Candidatus Schekmanbacteria bacterium]